MGSALRYSPFLALIALGLSPSLAGAQSVHHVDAAAPPGGDGSTWDLAFDDLQSALDASSAQDQVWVTMGTYRPSVRTDPADPRSATFRIPPGLELIGGFAGFEFGVEQRAGLVERCVLSGARGAAGDASDNAYRVVLLDENPQDRRTTIDGFRIRGGNADGVNGAPIRGGGVFVTLGPGAGFGVRLDLRNCILEGNHADVGGALWVTGFARVEVTRCRFCGNTAETKGGAVAVQTGSLRVSNSHFSRNMTPGRGGAVYLNSIEQDDPVAGPRVCFVNSLFHTNLAGRGGAGFVDGTNTTRGRGTWVNCVLDANLALDRGGAFFARTGASNPAELEVANSILWANRAPLDPQLFGPGADVRHCIVRGGLAGPGNLASDPEFIDPVRLNYRTRVGSPARDSGDNSRVPLDITDLDRDGDLLERVPRDVVGRPRFLDDPLAADTGSGSGPIVDIGLYEH